MNLHWEIISLEMIAVLKAFASHDIGQHFYLAGGTALALQLGHRRSVDLDFFSPTEDIPSIRRSLEDALAPYQPVLADTSWGNLVYIAQGIRVGFYGYGYTLIEPLIEVENARLAGMIDIALMKLDAILGRASRKDFLDLYIICQQVALQEILQQASRKYPGVRDFESQVAKRLTYFARADQDERVILFDDVPWEKVKEYFTAQAISVGKSWID